MTAYRLAIERAASRVAISPDLVEALTIVESSSDPWAWNPEPRFRYFWDTKRHKPFRAITEAESASEFPPSDFKPIAGDADQEWWGQQASWGLMQIMGAVARERGYRAPYLTSLCDVEINLRIGCEHLAGLLSWAAGDVTRALAAWNGGKGGNARPPFRNAAYAAKVLARMQVSV